MKIQFHPQASEELLESARFYEEQVAGLGFDFLDAVEHTLTRIEDFPTAAPIIRSTICKKLVLGFPFAILYSAMADSILVLADMYLHRKPYHWRTRMGT